MISRAFSERRTIYLFVSGIIYEPSIYLLPLHFNVPWAVAVIQHCYSNIRVNIIVIVSSWDKCSEFDQEGLIWPWDVSFRLTVSVSLLSKGVSCYTVCCTIRHKAHLICLDLIATAATRHTQVLVVFFGLGVLVKPLCMFSFPIRFYVQRRERCVLLVSTNRSMRWINIINPYAYWLSIKRVTFMQRSALYFFSCSRLYP